VYWSRDGDDFDDPGRRSGVEGDASNRRVGNSTGANATAAVTTASYMGKHANMYYIHTYDMYLCIYVCITAACHVSRTSQAPPQLASLFPICIHT
jgi:hypothetical protein